MRCERNGCWYAASRPTAGFALFDAGLQPTLIGDLVLGSSLDRSGELGVRLWKHHFGQVVSLAEVLAD